MRRWRWRLVFAKRVRRRGPRSSRRWPSGNALTLTSGRPPATTSAPGSAICTRRTVSVQPNIFRRSAPIATSSWVSRAGPHSWPHWGRWGGGDVAVLAWPTPAGVLVRPAGCRRCRTDAGRHERVRRHPRGNLLSDRVGGTAARLAGAADLRPRPDGHRPHRSCDTFRARHRVLGFGVARPDDRTSRRRPGSIGLAGHQFRWLLRDELPRTTPGCVRWWPIRRSSTCVPTWCRSSPGWVGTPPRCSRPRRISVSTTSTRSPMRRCHPPSRRCRGR